MNFYAMAALLLALATAYMGTGLRPHEEGGRADPWRGTFSGRKAKPLMDESILSPQPNERIPPRAFNMVIPIAVMVSHDAPLSFHHGTGESHGRLGLHQRSLGGPDGTGSGVGPPACSDGERPSTI